MFTAVKTIQFLVIFYIIMILKTMLLPLPLFFLGDAS